jgi:hypothetical protein
MLIREVGIILEGIPLIYVDYHKSTVEDVDNVSKGALINSILQFAESAISSLESFESNKYHMIFQKGKMHTERRTEESNLIAYIILDREESYNRKEKKKLKELLESILDTFVERYDGADDTEISQFRDFKSEINRILGSLTKTLDDKVSSLFP